MSSKKILHTLAVIFTIIIFLIRRAFLTYRDNPPMKKKNFFECPDNLGFGDTSETRVNFPQSSNCVMSLSCFDPFNNIAAPKYKKDPDIRLDDEDIGRYPLEDYYD